MKRKNKKLVKSEDDADSCEDVLAYFQCKPVSLCERVISLDDQYILNVCGTKSNVVAQSSNNDCILLSIEKDLHVVNKFTIDRKVCGVKFAPNDDNLLYIACKDGSIQLYDIRTEKLIREYKEELDVDRKKPISSFDIASTGKVLCAGSELFQSHAFVMFYDQRVSKPLGGYWDSHTDEVTQVKFHPSKSHKLVTGSSDGLINVFDISEQSEDDALQYSLNTETLVDKISWLTEDTISLISQEQELQTWNVDSADKLNQFSRESITANMKRTSVADCYLVDIFQNKDGHASLLCGSQFGKGNVLRSLNLTESQLQPHANFTDNKQIVRCSWNNRENNLLMTGGESGIVNVWRMDRENSDLEARADQAISKNISKIKLHHSKPYHKKKH